MGDDQPAWLDEVADFDFTDVDYVAARDWGLKRFEEQDRLKHMPLLDNFLARQRKDSQ